MGLHRRVRRAAGCAFDSARSPCNVRVLRADPFDAGVGIKNGGLIQMRRIARAREGERSSVSS
jgi:hypothetical protein